MNSIFLRLNALEQRPQSRIPAFRVQFADGNEQIAHGYELLRLDNVARVHFDTTNSCADTVIGLFKALRGDGVEVVPYVH